VVDFYSKYLEDHFRQSLDNDSLKTAQDPWDSNPEEVLLVRHQ